MSSQLVILDDGAPAAHNLASVGMFVSHNDTGVLIECGPTVPGALARCGIDILSVTDLFVSHDHIDHIKGYEDLLAMMIQAALVRGESHVLRLWGSGRMVNRLMDLAYKMPEMRKKRKKRIKPLTVRPGKQDQRFEVFDVNHYGLQCSGLSCRLNGQRLTYFGDSGNLTDFAAILESLPPTDILVVEANHGLRSSTPKHLGWTDALTVFEMAKSRGRKMQKIVWHVRHDRERIKKMALENGVIFAEKETSILSGG